MDSYLDFLKLGGSQPPEQLLATAKVDPMDSKTYQLALDFYRGLVDEYEQICSQQGA